MPDRPDSTTDPTDSPVYQIRLKGNLHGSWELWFPGFTITREEGGETTLTGPAVDQAALHGLLKKVRDLGVPLISVNRTDPGRTT